MELNRRNVLAGSLTLFPGASAQSVFASQASQPDETTMTPLSQIRQIDYTVIFARDLAAMRAFYEKVLEFPVLRTLGESWIEYAVGSNRLALTVRGLVFNDVPTPEGALSLQLAFRVAPGEVAKCAEAIEAKGVKLAAPVTDQQWGHRTVFFRDPDGNVIEIYADI